jgi:hypothetical protein
MARGNPDYNVPDYSFFAVETPLSDVIAERQGFSRLDNRGRILWMDDFRSGLYKWNLDNIDPGVVPVQVMEQGFLLGNHGSVKLQSINNDGSSGMFNQIIMPVSKRLGIEAGIYLPLHYADFNIVLSHLYSGSVMYGMQFIITSNTGAIGITTPSGLINVFTPSNISLLINRWIAIKLVADFSTGQYVRMMLGNTQYDFTAQNMSTGANGLVGATGAEIYSAAYSATHKEPVYVSHVIISGDEP